MQSSLGVQVSALSGLLVTLEVFILSLKRLAKPIFLFKWANLNKNGYVFQNFLVVDGVRLV